MNQLKNNLFIVYAWTEYLLSYLLLENIFVCHFMLHESFKEALTTGRK